MNKDALVKVFDLYASSLFNYALRLCGDAVLADHIVGDVFVKLLEQLNAGNGPRSNLRAYLYEMTYHRIIDEARSARRSRCSRGTCPAGSARRRSAPAVTMCGSPASSALIACIEPRVAFRGLSR